LYVGPAVSFFRVRVSHKVRKLFSLDSVQSLSEHVSRWRHPVSAARILATIDQSALDQLREKYPRRPDSPQINRFEDARYCVRINLKRVQDLWIDRTEPIRILDLGCGSGFFLYICKLFHHDVVGLDRDTNPMFRAITEFLGVPRIAADIEPFTKLPDLGAPFDLVTAYRICFQRIGTETKGVWKEWGAAEWKFFLDDVRDNHLRPDGRLLLDFNPRPDGTYFDPDVRKCFESEGALFFRSKVLFAADPTKRPRFRDLAIDQRT
jgi:SAM-dependent methyltransferase